MWDLRNSKEIRLRVFELTMQGGNDSFGVHCPTKTAPLECDIKRGRSLDVPAGDKVFIYFYALQCRIVVAPTSAL